MTDSNMYVTPQLRPIGPTNRYVGRFDYAEFLVEESYVSVMPDFSPAADATRGSVPLTDPTEASSNRPLSDHTAQVNNTTSVRKRSRNITLAGTGLPANQDRVTKPRRSRRLAGQQAQQFAPPQKCLQPYNKSPESFEKSILS